jgi:uncharacterized protein with GYD domain
MLGKYSSEAIKGITAERTKEVMDTIEKCGGKTGSMYALLGSYDLAFVVDFPGDKEALKASVTLTRLTGIGFTTSPAFTVEEFDKVIG